MRDFNKVSPTLWQSGRFVGLPSDDGRLLYLYLLTCPHQNKSGCFWLPAGYACNDLRWDEVRYQAARQELVGAGLIQVDDDAGYVLIERWSKHNPPMNQSHLKGIVAELQKCGSAALQEVCAVALNEVWHEKFGGKPNGQVCKSSLPFMTPDTKPPRTPNLYR